MIFWKKLKKNMIFSISPSTLCFTIHFWWFFVKNTKKKLIFDVLTKKPNKSSNVICVLFFHVLGRHFEICGVFLIKNGKLHRRWNGTEFNFIQTCQHSVETKKPELSRRPPPPTLPSRWRSWVELYSDFETR